MSEAPTNEEQTEFSIRAFRGVEVCLGQADPIAAIAAKLAADGMTINPKKIRLAPVAAGVPFLGYVVWPNHISAGRYVRSRFLYRLRQHESGGYDRSESLQSYRAMFAHTGATR